MALTVQLRRGTNDPQAQPRAKLRQAIADNREESERLQALEQAQLRSQDNVWAARQVLTNAETNLVKAREPRLLGRPFRPYFALLPRDTEAAATLAEHRSEWLADRAWAKTRHRRELRHAIEIRHESFLDPAFVALMRKHRVALVFADSVA